MRSGLTIAVASVVAIAAASGVIASAYGAFVTVDVHATENRQIQSLTTALFGAAPAAANVPSYPPPATVLASRPLDSAALTRGGLQASLAGDRNRAIALMAAALHRDPRSRAARLWILTDALKHNDVTGGLAQLDRLMALGPQSEPYFPTLAELARQPAAERPLAAMLAANPIWRDQFLGYLTAHSVDADLIFRLTSNGAATKGVGVQAALIDKLIAKGDYNGAYLAWVNFLPESALSSVAPVYDGGFAGLSGPQPFNWLFNDGDSASVGIEKGQGLQIDYPSARSVQMARQLLVLKAGTYRLDFVARGSGEAEDGGIVSWHLACAKGAPVLIDLPMKDLGDKPAARAARFTVPADCPAQLFSIEGTAGLFPKTRTVSIVRVSIAALR